MTRIMIILLAATILTSCKNVLTLHKKKYYQEDNKIIRKSPLTLIQQVYYDVPSSHDEEQYYILTLNFIDTAAAKSKRVLDLSCDTAIVKGTYEFRQNRMLNSGKYKVKGKIKIISWNNDNEIILKEKIIAINYTRKRI